MLIEKKTRRIGKTLDNKKEKFINIYIQDYKSKKGQSCD